MCMRVYSVCVCVCVCACVCVCVCVRERERRGGERVCIPIEWMGWKALTFCRKNWKQFV